MEYLMTYGWAILVIIIVIAVLFYIGVLNPRNYVPRQCQFQPGLICASYRLNANTSVLDLQLSNALGHPILVQDMVCTQQTVTPGDANFSWTVSVANYTDTSLSQGATNIRVAGAASSNTAFECVGTTGNDLTNTASAAFGESYRGRVWIRYQETDTGTVRTISGDLTTNFE